MSGKISTIKSISRDDFARMLEWQERNAVSQGPYLRDYTILLFLGDAGLRVGELSLLNVGDCLTTTEVVRSLRVRSAIAKYRVERIVPLSNRLRDSLVQYLREFALGRYLDREAFLLPGRKPSSHLSTKQIQNVVSRISLAALGRSIHPHLLRHSFATHLMRTTPMPVVQRLLGHKYLSSTQIYCHPDDKDLLDAIKTL